MLSLGTDEDMEEVVRKYAPMMLHSAFALLRNTADAEDAVQDTFLKLIRKRPNFKDEEHVKAWLLRVTVNKAKDMLRSSARKCTELAEETVFEYSEDTDLLNEVLNLPEKYRLVIHLYYYEGYSVKEIASILNKPPTTVNTRLDRGRKMLRTSLEGENNE